MSDEFIKKDDESSYDYLLRMVNAVKDMTWSEGYAEWMKQVFDVSLSEDAARKEFYGIRRLIGYMGEDADYDISKEELMDSLKERELAIDKKRIQLNDELSYVQRLKRDLARGETIKEYAIEAAKEAAKVTPFVDIYVKPSGGTDDNGEDNIAILCLGDWHYGLDINNEVNVYNPDVAKYRLRKLYEKVMNDVHTFHINKLIIVNLGDLISGIIHTTIRLENRIDVITQVMQVSEILASLIHDLSGNIEKVEYHSVTDNHARVMAMKEESLDRENFNRLIDFYIQERLSHIGNIDIIINDNQSDDYDISTFKAGKWNVVAVHGHDDSPTKAIDELSGMLHKDYDLCLMGHRHSPTVSESYEDWTVGNGCLCGSDNLARDIRRTSKPSQNLIIMSNNDPCEYLHCIKL